MDNTIVNTIDGKELAAMGFGKTEEEFRQLLLDAKEADEEDRRLTIRQALRKFRPAVIWAMVLSLTLIMEVSQIRCEA